ASWHILQRELEISIRWGGSLEWFPNPARQNRLVEQIEEQVEWGEPARMLTVDEVAELEPQLQIKTDSLIAFSPTDGAVDPVIATQRLLKGAERFGAKIIYPCELLDIETSNGSLNSVVTSKGSIKADRLVLATGAAPNLAKKFAGIEIPQRTTPGAIFITKPMARLMNRIIVAPGVHMHQRDDGRIVLGEQEGAPNTEAHKERLKNRPKEFPSFAIAQQHADRVLSVAANFIPGIDAAELEQAYIGWRPLPIDGHPVLGSSPQQPDVYLAIMHSGVSLAPIVGEIVAKELASGESLDSIEHYRPTRKFANVSRY
ncbi:MAG: FAD-dependent oxidoreductase, partial [Pseudomonadota bacterium]